MAGGKRVNQTELSTIIDVSAVTIRSWEKEGMPVVAKGTSGKSAVYNTADVIRWCERRLVAKYAVAGEGDYKAFLPAFMTADAEQPV